jgi:nucleoid-associated protein YgaU
MLPDMVYTLWSAVFPVRGRFAMKIADLDAPTFVSRSTHKRFLPVSLRLGIPGVLVFALAAVGAAQSYAQDQDVAEAARQERARKQSQQKRPRHVFTAEDLKREHILSPEDRAQVEARKNQPTPAGPRKPQDAVYGSAVARDSDTQPLPANAPLGDIARRVRGQKESQKPQRSAEFHLPFADVPVLASPKSPVQPLRPSISATKPAPPLAAPFHPPAKRSPFERPRFLPPAPAAPRTLVSPLPAPHVLPTPPRARVASSAPAKLTVITVRPGDSLWKLAAQRLGSGRRWQELLSINPDLRDPNFIKVGSQLVLPASVAPPRATTKYTVRNGDTLWTIAQSHLGHGAFWACIARANPAIRDANLIYEGQVLLLPATCSL